MKILPEKLLKLMSPVDRQALGQQTAQEAADVGEQRSERDEQRLFCNWLLLHEGESELTWCSGATHKPATIRVGWPDFQVHRKGKSLFLEFKVASGRLTEEQLLFQHRIKAQGFPYVVAPDAKAAIEAVKRHLFGQIPPRPEVRCEKKEGGL